MKLTTKTTKKEIFFTAYTIHSISVFSKYLVGIILALRPDKLRANLINFHTQSGIFPKFQKIKSSLIVNT